MDLVGGRGLPRQLRFEKFVCQNERIWTLRVGRALGTPPSRSANVFKCSGNVFYRKSTIGTKIAAIEANNDRLSPKMNGKVSAGKNTLIQNENYAEQKSSYPNTYHHAHVFR